MTTVTFDTLQFVKKLQAKGFKTDQAEGISEALRDVMTVAEVATARDLKELEMTLKAGIERLELKIQAQISPLKWMVGVASAGIISLVLKAFFPV